MTNNHGGKRSGAGRPPVPEPRKPRCFRLTDKEYQATKDFIKGMKNNLKK